MKKDFKGILSNSSLCWFIIAIATIVGIIIRFKGLATWPLALDEYYIIKSSEFILEHGLPQFPNGGYYSRGILLQYMIASLLSMKIQPEFAGRIFSVLANIISIPALYLISKRLGNQLIATVVVVIFSLSIWEIEFSRFARMYTPFQVIFLWYFYFALKDYQRKNLNNYKWMLLLSAISFLVYEGSIFLAVFNFVPLILHRKIKINYLLWSLIVLMLSVFFNKFDFRNMSTNPILPPKYSEEIINQLKTSPIMLPKILFQYAFNNIISAILTIFLILTNSLLARKIIKYLDRKNILSILIVILITVLALFNQFGLLILVFIMSVFWDLLEIERDRYKIFMLVTAVLLINLIYWSGFGLFSSNWYKLFDDFASYDVWGISKRLLVGFFNFPDSYFSISNYYLTLPILTIFTSLVSIIYISLLFMKEKKEDKEIKFMIGSIIFLSLLATIPNLIYQETRYTFFAVPLVILLSNISLYKLFELHLSNRKAIIVSYITVISLLFISSNDFSIYHLANIDEKEVNYRLIYNKHIKKHLYRRWDINDPIAFVKNNSNIDDVIIINENSLEYYLPKVDYFFIDYNHHAFSIFSVENGTKERWSNSKLISSNEEMIKFIENRTKTIWLLIFPENYLSKMDFYKKYEDFLVFEGIDNLIKVYKFPSKM